MAPDTQKHLNTQIECTLNPIIAERLPSSGGEICVIDPPWHANVGDSAILLGELDYLQKNFPRTKLGFYDLRNYSEDAARHIEKADVLVIHGGGNFGDIWPHHHNFRLKILDRFKSKSIIQFPQSIHFSSEVELAKTANVISSQNDFTLLTRDRRSFDFAQKNFRCSSFLTPDMVFAMKPITRRRARIDCFGLLRTDKEVRSDHQAIISAVEESGRSIETGDWLDEPKGPIVKLDRKVSRLMASRPALLAPFRSETLSLRQAFARRRLEVGVEMLSRGSMVVTDRLHAHLLSCLLHIPHVAFDSFDGKISAFYENWTNAFDSARFCGSATDLPRLLQDAAFSGRAGS